MNPENEIPTPLTDALSETMCRTGNYERWRNLSRSLERRAVSAEEELAKRKQSYFCAECGSDKFTDPDLYSMGSRICECGQEWFVDVDYLDNAIRSNLASGFKAKQALAASRAENARLRGSLERLHKAFEGSYPNMTDERFLALEQASDTLAGGKEVEA